MKPNVEQTRFSFTTIYCLYLVLLIAVFTASFFPNHRTWGFNVWGYFSVWVPFILLGLGLVLPTTFLFSVRHRAWTVTEECHVFDRKYLLATTCLIVLLGLAFYFLRARTHFLGDGYTLISLLSSSHPLIEKYRELGESLAHIWLYATIGGNSEHDAVLTYQIISIAAGIVFLVSVALFSKAIFKETNSRLLFFLGMVSGGYMLLYFGYVENYSLFILSVVAYCLTGLLALKGQQSRWVLLLLQALTIFFHIFGVTLIPATAYLLIKNSKLEDQLLRLSRKTKLLIGLAIVGLALFVFSYAYSTDYFFRLALVSLFNHRFVQEGYTLFSLKHLADLGNLLMVLLPGLPIFLVVLMRIPLRRLLKRAEYRWLGIVVICTLGATFIFDPKIGMPRDWDLFSFPGIPLSVLCYYTILDNRRRIYGYASIIMLSVVLGFLVLIPRAVSLTIPKVAIDHFRNYLYWDRVKNQNGWIFLTSYYKSVGDSTKWAEALVEWKSNFPEERLMAQANELYYQEKNIGQTLVLLYRILDINPTYPAAYSFLGFCYLELQQYDSATTLLKLADALSPNRPNNINNLGHAYFYKGEYKKAEKAFLKAAYLDSAGYSAQYNLAQFYRYRKQPDKYYHYLAIAASRPNAPAPIVKELIGYHLQQGEIKQAAGIFKGAEQLYSDTAFVRSIKELYPQLDSLLQ